MRSSLRWLLIIEILVCFLPCSLMLVVGAVMLPAQVVWLFQEPLNWEGTAWTLFSVLGGTIGLCTLAFLVSRLFAGSEKIENPAAVLGGVLLGAAPLLLTLWIALPSEGEAEWATLTFTTLLPLSATAHILFLSRKLFIAGFTDTKQPFIRPGTWIGATLVGGLIVFVLVLQRGAGYAALEERRAYWMQHKPAAYSYQSSVGGWLEPPSIGYPKQIRVVGSNVTGASYTFVPSPGDTIQFPPPIAGAWTIDDLFDALLDAKRKGARVQVRFDRSTGAVLHARVEGETNDSGWTYEVREFRALDPAEAHQPAPMFISRQ